MSGVTSTGFVPKTLDEIIADLQAGYRSVFGAAVNVDDRSRNGQLIATFAEKLSEVWELGEHIATLLNPNAASGQGLDNVAALTGTAREPASKSTVTLTLTGTATTVVASGKIASVSSTTAKFATTAPATIAAATAWASTTGYTVGQRRKNGGTSRIYQCITAGTSAGSGGPTSTAADITDGTVHWKYLGDGNGVVDVAAEATVTGPVQGYASTITSIDTAVSGWSGVINLLDAVPGNDIETDSALRLRREEEIGGQGHSPLPALRAAILRVDGVTACTIFENATDNTVGNLTPHSFEALVEGGVDADILQAIFDSAPGGIQSIGTTSGTVTDSAGNGHTYKFSRVSEVDLYVEISLTKDPTQYPTDGDDQCKAIIVELGDALRTGRDAIGIQIASWLFPRTLEDGTTVGVPGVLNVTTSKVDTVTPAVTTSATLTNRQHASFDTSRITITAIDGTP